MRRVGGGGTNTITATLYPRSFPRPLGLIGGQQLTLESSESAVSAALSDVTQSDFTLSNRQTNINISSDQTLHRQLTTRQTARSPVSARPKSDLTPR